MVRADAIFAATGVTNGALLDGVRIAGGFVRTHTPGDELRHPHGARSADEAAALMAWPAPATLAPAPTTSWASRARSSGRRWRARPADPELTVREHQAAPGPRRAAGPGAGRRAASPPRPARATCGRR